MSEPHAPSLPLLVLLASLALTCGCASNSAASEDEAEAAGDPVDPWEPLNRRIHSFNRTADRYTLKPAAKGYEKVVPQTVRTGLRNFWKNLNGPLHIVNNFLQGQGRDGASETGRLLVNTTVGIGGFFDVATELGLERHEEDFGQTLAVWGVPDGPFVMVPFWGPQTLRDAVALPLDFLADPLFHLKNDRERYGLFALRVLDIRARLFPIEDMLEDSYDEYVSIREAYLQNRRFEVHDGDPPQEDDYFDDFYGELPEEEGLDEPE